MNVRRLTKLSRMDAGEIAWRGRAAARTALDRARVGLMGSRWARASLYRSLAPLDELAGVRAALKAARWDAAHRELSHHFAQAAPRFAISARTKAAVIDRILGEFPDAAQDAVRHADRIVSGEYDLLGYERLQFGTPDLPDRPDWSFDPVSGRRAPAKFWAAVPFLDPSCGDHKVIWELNRHQHWLALGRAYWLTGVPPYRDRFLAELRGWLDANPPLTGINWASMLEVALRSISWLWAIHLFVQDGDDDWPWLVDLLLALDRQLTHVERNLSCYFSPNTHLLGEALALYVTGRALPELAASRRRADIGRAVLVREIDRQIAADGGHRERSTHYHRYTLDFYSLALIVARQTGDQAAAAAFRDAVSRAGAAARLLADDNGRVPHIGDDDGGALAPILSRDPDDLRASLAVAAALADRPGLRIGAAPEEAYWLLGPDAAIGGSHSSRAAVESSALPETGYYVSRSPAGDHLVVDGGPHGYQNGGHAHADALSLTFTVRRVPLLIDAGTGCYTTDLGLRDRLRSTAAHNTLTIDGRSQSLPDGPFHWSHVANGQVHRWHTDAGFDYFDASHDGYRPVEHRRRVFALHGDLLVVADFVAGPGRHAATLHWHVDPRWAVATRAHGATFTRGDAGDRVGMSVPEGVVDSLSGDADTGLGWYSSVYGRVERTTTVRVAHEAAAPFWMVSVFDLDPLNAVTDVHWVPVWAEAGALAHGSAVRISRAASVDHVLFAEPAHPAATCRVGDVETDARMLIYRASAGRPIVCLGAVDATTARTRNLELLSRDLMNPDPVSSPCAASPVS